MADSERRYGPTIDLQGFDLRTEMDTIDEPSRLPLLVVIALVVLAAFAGVVWLAYTQGVERGRESVSRELVAQAFWKVHKPEGPAYAGLKIYEQPSAPTRSADANAAAPPKAAAANAIPTLRPTASAMPDNPLSTAQPVSGTTAPDRVRGSPALPPVNKRAAWTAKVPGASLERVATRAPTDLTKAAAAPPVISHPITAPDSVTSTPPPKPAIAPASAAPPVAAPVKAVPARALNGIVLQIGSYKSDAEAMQSWSSFRTEHDAASGYQPDVSKVDLGAKGTWYRLRIGPFADRKAALETCAKLKADGASCLLGQ
ncbi:MAG TPA: SPOR domain-containing protein [Rhizomicrobium sp.]|jgi:cell division protein FtsN|nr:SPOR domain-containing protein [Rhizomicrobium sp.]